MIFSDPSFWVGLAFIIVISFLMKKSWSSIEHGLDSRSKKIKERINEAKELREEAQYLLSEYKRKQLNAQAEIRTISEETDKEIKQIRKKAKDMLEVHFERKKLQASERIQQSEKQAVELIRQRSINIALLATERLIKENLTSEQKHKLINDSINDLPGALNKSYQ